MTLSQQNIGKMCELAGEAARWSGEQVSIRVGTGRAARWFTFKPDGTVWVGTEEDGFRKVS